MLDRRRLDRRQGAPRRDHARARRALPRLRLRAPHGLLDARALRRHPRARAVARAPPLLRAGAGRRARRGGSAARAGSGARRGLTAAALFLAPRTPIIDRTSMDATLLLDLYRQMCLSRRFEEAAAKAYSQGKVSGFLHLYIGQEAVAVGAISAAEPTDYIVATYRDHAHYLARTGDARGAMAELYGKAGGCVGGRGGAMHLFDRRQRLLRGRALVRAPRPRPGGGGPPSQD